MGKEDELSAEYVQKLISKECDEVKELLLLKNREYGNSALEPKRIFAKSSPVEQIKVRIDDKLSRINNFSNSIAFSKDSEDAVKDLIGYLILLRVAEKIYEKDGSL